MNLLFLSSFLLNRFKSVYSKQINQLVQKINVVQYFMNISHQNEHDDQLPAVAPSLITLPTL